jgi:hypothetical protein
MAWQDHGHNFCKKSKGIVKRDKLSESKNGKKKYLNEVRISSKRVVP